MPQEVAEKPGAVKLERFERAITFEDVRFRYPGANGRTASRSTASTWR